MDERQRLRQTALRFGSEVDRVMGSNFLDMPAPLERLLDALECEPVISAYLDDCVDHHLPADFDAAGLVDHVSDEAEATFGPFSDDHCGATAQRYLIVTELVQRDTKYHSPVFVGYGQGSEHLADKARGFMDEMVVELIADVNAYLEASARELGLEELKAPKEAPAEAEPAGPERLAALLHELEGAVEELPADDREDALLQVEALSDELACEAPKRSVVRVVLRALKAMSTDARVTEAVERLQAYLEANGVL